MKKTTLLLIGANGCWAKETLPDRVDGSALKKAITRVRRRAHGPTHYNAYWVTEKTVVSDHGSTLYPGDPETDAPELIGKV